MNSFKLSKITVSITNIDLMVNFYKTVFDCDFKEINAFGTTLYSDSFCGINILLCPNTIAGVVAEQNRQQFDIEVTDINKTIQNVITAGGSLKREIEQNTNQKIASIVDPDGNTMVFIQNLITP